MKSVKLFLRAAIGLAFLSAVADRFGLWSPAYSAWGNWDSFVAYTAVLLPWSSPSLVSIAAILATAAEIIFGICLLIGFQTERIARFSGWLLLLFAITMTFSLGIKKPLDYSVFTASAAAFALSTMKTKFWEVDMLLKKKHK